MQLFGNVLCGKKTYRSGLKADISVYKATDDYTIYRNIMLTDKGEKIVSVFAHFNPEKFNIIQCIHLNEDALEIIYNITFTPYGEGVLFFTKRRYFNEWLDCMQRETREMSQYWVRFERPWCVTWETKHDSYTARYTKERYYKCLDVVDEVVAELYDAIE